MKILLRNADWLIRDSQRVEQNGAVLVDKNKIVSVGPTAEVEQHAPEGKDIEVVDCKGCIVMPGLVNAHNHVFQISERGLGKNLTMEEWLRKLIYPINKILTSDDHYALATMACADSFRNGVTSMVEQLTNFARFHAESECRAFLDCGMRAAVARGVSTQSTIDPGENADPAEEYETARKYLADWQGKGLVRPWLGPAGLYSTDEKTLKLLKDLCSEAGAGFHIHLSETRQQAEFARRQGYSGQVDWAYRLGLLDGQTSVAHAVWINPAEIELLRQTGAKVVHNPSSNQVLSSGVANVPMWLEKGLDVALGTDGPASNDSLDMIAEMKSCVLLHRVNTLNPNILSAGDAFRMATQGGAAVLGLSGELGMLEPGYLADIACVRYEGNPSLNPIYDPLEALVYYGSGRDVCTTIVNGNIVYREGRYLSLDLDGSLRSIREIAQKVKGTGLIPGPTSAPTPRASSATARSG